MDPAIAALFRLFIYALIVAIFLRAILSWFPVDPHAPYYRFLVRLTEPLLEPIRRVLPRLGMIDLSPMVVLLLLYLMLSVVNRLASG
ncbi:MAG: YggT family protein [Chloroflexota bacterium]|jgi:YggT family protein|nr:YggT family protein [Chloroflexota bacterium]